MKRTALLAVLTFVVTWSWTSPAPATLYIYEPFNYSYYVAGIPLNGQVYDGSTSPQRIWRLAANSSSTSRTAGLTIGNGSLGGSGNSALMTSTPGNTGAAERLGINSNSTTAGDVTSGTIYYSFLLNVQSISTFGTNFRLFFGLNDQDNSSTANDPTVLPGRMYARVNQADQTFDLAVVNNRQTTNVITAGDQAWSSNVAAYSGGLHVRQTYFIVGAYDLGAAKSSLWINPSTASYSANTAPTADRVDATAGNSFSPGIGSALLVQNPITFLWLDELRVASTWAEVTGSSVFLTGDYNRNGIVDAADYTVWRDGLGTTYTQADYNIWKANLGAHAGSGSGASAAAPEPSTFVLLILAAAGIFIRRHRTVTLASKLINA
jgi:hypothetical protein